MKAVCRQQHHTMLTNLEQTTTLADDYVRLKVLYVGICRTDIAVAKGTVEVQQPMVIGHEASAEVIAVGSAIEAVEVGDIVSIIPMSPCLQCAACKAQQFDLCHDSAFAGLHTSGYLRQFVDLPGSYLYKYNQSTHPVLVAYTEPVAAALAVFNFPELLTGRGAILGNNRFSKLIQFIFSTKGLELPTIIEDIPLENSYDFLIETGMDSPDIDAWLQAINRGGSLIVRSRSNSILQFNARLLLEKQIRIQGVSYARYSTAVSFIESHQADLMQFVGNIYELEDFQQAFEQSEKNVAFKNFIKVH